MSIVRIIKKYPAILVLVAMTGWSSLASADPITVEFEIGGFSGNAMISGSFTGEDTNNTGTLGHGILGIYEISAFNLRWSGNSRTAAFRHGLGNLRTLLYDIGSQTLLGFGSSRNGTSANLLDIWIPFVGTIRAGSVNGPKSGCFFCSDPDKQVVKYPGVTTTQVPEPGTLTLFGIGLLAVGFATRRRQV